LSADYIRKVPRIDLPDDELTAVIAALRGVIEDDKFPHAPRLDPLRAALAKLEAAAEPTAPAKAPPAAKARQEGAAIDTRGSRSERDHRHSVSTRGRV
jgi:hypothetical protein